MNHCPVCHKDTPGEEFSCTDHYVTGEVFTIRRCAGCGFRMTAHAPGPEASERYYQSEEYVSHSNTKKGPVNQAYHLARSLMLHQKLKIIRASTQRVTGSVLDIGAGTGFFLHHMKKKGWSVTGVEKSSQARDFALHHLYLPLLPAASFFDLPEHSFDAITLWHVLEHLHNLQDYREKLALLLKPSGSLVIALPNPASTDAKYYGEFWAAWDVPRHLWHFTPENVEQWAATGGFVLIKRYRMPFDAFYVSILSEKYRKSSFPLLKGVFRGKISWLVSLFRPEKCSSLVYVFKLKQQTRPS